MKTLLRIFFPAFVLFAACYGQRALMVHLAAAMFPPSHQVAPALAALPETIGPWRGEDETIAMVEPASLGSLRRTYFHATTGEAATVFLTYSPAGHDPTGNVEAISAMTRGTADATVPLIAEIGPGLFVSQLRSATGRDARWMFRRVYPLPLLHEPRLDVVQTMYRRLRVTPPHVVLEVFVPENFPTDLATSREFVQLVDAAVRPLLGAIGSPVRQELPINLVSN